MDALLARGPYYRHTMDLLEKVKSGEVEGWSHRSAVRRCHRAVKEETRATEADLEKGSARVNSHTDLDEEMVEWEKFEAGDE